MCYALFRSRTCIAFRNLGVPTYTIIYVPMYYCSMPLCLHYCRLIVLRACVCVAWRIAAILFDRFPLKKGSECAEMFTQRFLGPSRARLCLCLVRTVSILREDASALAGWRGWDGRRRVRDSDAVQRDLGHQTE